jgi:hypothetical protein
MSLVSRSSAEAELAQLIKRFDHWRQTRATRHEPIPDWLWDQATQLTSHLPLSRVAKRLRLNRQELKKRCGSSRQRQPVPPTALPVADFIEVKAEPAWLATGMALDLQRPDGTRLHIEYREPQPPLAAVVHAFLETC